MRNTLIIKIYHHFVTGAGVIVALGEVAAVKQSLEIGTKVVPYICKLCKRHLLLTEK